MVEEIGMDKSSCSKNSWQRLSSKLVYSSPYVNVHNDGVRLPDGTEIEYARIDERPFSIVVPMISGKLVMLYNYRYPLNEMSLEFPSGHIEKGESPAEAAERELEEEVGYIAEKLRQIGEFCPSVRSNQRAHVFVTEVSKKGTLSRDKCEMQRTVILSVDEVYRELREARINHAASIVALAFSQPFLVAKH
jgi:ADP-ribose pyrophosphatase